MIRQNQDIPGIQYLRGLAAFLVVLYHAAQHAAKLTPAAPPFINFNAGVDIFFVISGFVMVLSTRGGTKLSPSMFMWRRIERIVPLYWLVTLTMAAMLLIAPQFARTARFGVGNLIGSLAFLPVQNPVGGAYVPLLTAGWTLNLEMFFYACFAAAMAVGDRRPVRILTIASAPLIALALIGVWRPTHGAFGFYTNPILLEFVAGMMLAAIYERGGRIARPTGILLIAVGLSLLLLPPGTDDLRRPIRYGIPAAMIVTGGAFAPFPRWRLPHLLGDISYSLYLTHFLVLAVFTQVFEHLMPSRTGGWLVGYFVGGAATAVAAGYLCWRWVERPLMQASRQVANTVRRPHESRRA